VIGVPRTATASQIKKAYFKAALVCHPDKGGDSAKFQELSRAHCVLSDPEKRRIYDQTGIVDDGADDDFASGDFNHWETYFRAMFPSLTIERIDEFAQSYRGSEEEKSAVLAAYQDQQGCLS
jgi:DnaJ homolog subfamily C member 9